MSCNLIFDLTAVYVKYDEISKAPRGFGFVMFDSPADAARACSELNGAVCPSSHMQPQHL